jgi:hypothetical protein
VARRLDRSVEDVRAILALNEHTASLDAPLDIDPSCPSASPWPTRTPIRRMSRSRIWRSRPWCATG